MKITIAFSVVLGSILLVGSLIARSERRRGVADDGAGSARAVLPLGLVEARRLALHPAFLGLLAFGVLAMTLAQFLDEPDQIGDPNSGFFVILGNVLACIALIVAADRNTSRSTRDGTEELFRSTPTSLRARTSAHLLAGLGPVPLLLVVCIGAVVIHRIDVSAPDPAGLPLLLPLYLAALAAGGAVVGVLIARWLPFAMASLLAVVAVIALNNQFDHLDPRWRWLRFAAEPSFGGRFDIRHDHRQLLLVLSLVALGAVITLARHGISLRLGGALVVSVGLVLASGVFATRLPSAELVAERVAELEDPEAHQECVDEPVKICVYPEYVGWDELWAPGIEGVLALVPAEAVPDDLTVVQRMLPGAYDDLLPDIRAALDPELAWVDDGLIHPGLELRTTEAEVEVAYQTAALVVGLPPAVSWGRPACSAGGQARALVAFWLTAASSDSSAQSLRDVLADGGDLAQVNVEVIPDWESDYGTPNDMLPVQGSGARPADLAAALVLSDEPTERVSAAVAEHWDEVTDPETPASTVFGWLGLDAPAGLAQSAPVSVDDEGACP